MKTISLAKQRYFWKKKLRFFLVGVLQEVSKILRFVLLAAKRLIKMQKKMKLHLSLLLPTDTHVLAYINKASKKMEIDKVEGKKGEKKVEVKNLERLKIADFLGKKRVLKISNSFNSLQATMGQKLSNLGFILVMVWGIKQQVKPEML